MTTRRRSVWLYRVLLRLYPSSFHDRFATSMVDSFTRDVTLRRGAAVLAFWALTVWHVVSGAAVEHLVALRARRHVRRTPEPLLGGLSTDIKLAIRGVRTNKGLATVVIATLGIGVAASTAIFSVVNTLALRPLPFEESDRLLRLRDTVDRPGEASWWYNSSARSFVFVQENNNSFERVTGGDYRRFNVTGLDEPVTIVGSVVSDGWLETLGIAPVLGRGFTAEEQALGSASRSMLIAHGLWTRRFGRTPDVLGSTMALDGEPYTVVGILPPGFNFPYGAELWVMGTFEPTARGSNPHVVARLAPGVSPDAGHRELARLTALAREAYPDTHRGIRFTGVGMREDLVGNRADLGFALLGAVGLLVLIACGNVANLLAIRATALRRSFAVRTALGASPFRQVRQVLVEVGVLALAGWTVGMVLAVSFTDAMAALSLAPTDSLGEFFSDIRVDHRVVLFSVALTGASTALTALGPALRAIRTDVRHAMGQRIGSQIKQPLLRAVVAAEVALAFVLLAGGGAVLDGLERLQRTDLGFETAGRLVVPLSISSFRYPDADDRGRYLRTLEERVAAIPAVLAAGMTQHTPVSLGDWTGQMTIEGGFESTADNALLTNFRSVTPGYLDALGASFVAGRRFAREENIEERNVVIVTETMAREHWAQQDPVGRRVKLGPVANDNPWLTVVGVVGDVKEEWNGVDPTWYVPYRQSPQVIMELVIHHEGTAQRIAGDVARAVASVDAEQPIGEIRTLGDLVDDSFAAERFGTLLVSAFALFGVTLSALGIYGALAFGVRQRTREIGLRLALGSPARRVLRDILATGIAIAGVGVAIGAVTLRLVSRLPRVQWADGDVNQFRLLSDGVSVGWTGAVVVTLLLAGVTLLASYLPARGAMRVSPAVALREG